MRLDRPARLFFFNDTATTEIYTLSLHDALPISRSNASWAPAAWPPCTSPTTRATIAKSPSSLAQQIRGERAGARPRRRGATEGTLQREDEPERGRPASRPLPRSALPRLSILEGRGFIRALS